MNKLIISGKNKLNGKVRLTAAKNAVLPLIAACLLTKEEVVFYDVPELSDVAAMIELIKSLGCRAEQCGNMLAIKCESVDPKKIDNDVVRKIRSSFFLLGALLARTGEAYIHTPGGCEIGSRPIDLHLSGLRRMGVAIDESSEIISCKGSPKGNFVTLSYPSVGATENIMMAAAGADGCTVIYGAAKEPEIADLASFINVLGGRISGAGTDVITVEGCRKFGGADYRPIPDRVVCSTYIAAVAVAKGEIIIENSPQFYDSSLLVFASAGVKIKSVGNVSRVKCVGKISPISSVITSPYPGFPTDSQPLLTSALCYADGQSKITETLFESRFRFADELRKMKADIRVNGRTAIINGGQLDGAGVTARDLRGGAALIVAAFGAEGISRISGIQHVERGYDNLPKTLSMLGAKISEL